MNGYSQNEPSFIFGLNKFVVYVTIRQMNEQLRVDDQKTKKNEICRIVSNGATVTQAAAELGICKTTLYNWVGEDKVFRDAFDSAKTDRIEAQLEDALDVLERVAEPVGDGHDHARVNAARLKVDTIKWFASKRLSKKYGDKTIHSNDPDNPMPSMQIYCPKEEKE